MSTFPEASQTFNTLECLQLFFTLACEKDYEDEESKKQKLLLRLKNKLLKRNEYCTDRENKAILDIVVNQGIYSEIVVSELLKNGMAKETIVKAMKRGLLNLQPDEFYPFKVFNVTPDNLNNPCDLKCDVDLELISKLKSVGIEEEDCFDILLNGLISQHKCCLFKLSLSGIVVTRILDWQGRIKCTPNKILKFLENFGVDECTCEYLCENGISEEAVEVLYELGYSDEWKEIIAEEETDSYYGESLTATTESTLTLYDSSINIKNLTESRYSIAEKANYLRELFTNPLTWALERTLKFQPKDPLHYIACQLLRWKYYLHSADHKNIKNRVHNAYAGKDKFYDTSRFKEVDSVPSSCVCSQTTEEDEVDFVKEPMRVHSICSYPQFCSCCNLSCYEYYENCEAHSCGETLNYSVTNLSSTSENNYDL